MCHRRECCPGEDGGYDLPGKAQLQPALADKLQAVFRPDGLWRLVRRKVGRGKCRLKYVFDDEKLNLAFTFSTVARTEVTLETTPSVRGKLPVFLPTRELLTISPDFVSLYETTHLPFEETWRDTCIFAGCAAGERSENTTSKKSSGSHRGGDGQRGAGQGRPFLS